ncbi:hypothetical protein [Ruficoccus sp. ZRK36]|uniref:hypothetical protein n=1 Tax=Ruficoccus sp. ZRK36 TaxID=2866311 RepID=UPI001C735DC9|nr:hypothetical protein [Ruficoccus sp. ZRK36]QYY37123.1 hypothetical protein K0V07_06485 [Ruficoccus sp. ZRK36]
MRIAAVVLLFAALGLAFTIVFISGPAKTSVDDEFMELQDESTSASAFRLLNWMFTGDDPADELVKTSQKLAYLNRALIFATLATGGLSFYLFRRSRPKRTVGFVRDS